MLIENLIVANLPVFFDTDALGLLLIGSFLFACGMIVYGEHYLITKYFFGTE